MKNFMTMNEFFENSMIPNTEHNLGINRISMPQIHTGDFLKGIANDPSINTTNMMANTQDLYPTQDQFNTDKVKTIVLGLRSGNEQKPIIVSDDNYIVDGHHRWAAHDNMDIPIPVIKVNLNVQDLLNYLQDKPYVENKNINESFNESLNEDKGKYNGISQTANMKRQLIDLLRIRVQKGMPTTSKDYSETLSNETEKLQNLPADEVESLYNKQMINNIFKPIFKS